MSELEHTGITPRSLNRSFSILPAVTAGLQKLDGVVPCELSEKMSGEDQLWVLFGRSEHSERSSVTASEASYRLSGANSEPRIHIDKNMYRVLKELSM